MNGDGATNPFRLDRSQAATADQDHDYTPEQQAFHGGLMDLFPKYTGTPGPPPNGQPTTGLVMGYYDGNTVTAFWNYAQRFAMSDNSYGTNFGPSTDGAVNLISGQLNGVSDQVNATGDVVSDGGGGYTLVSDADPVGDVCSTTTGAQVAMSGQNVGDLLNAAGISWGFFEGGFDLTVKNANGTTGCSPQHHFHGHHDQQGGLHSASSALPVLHLHPEPEAHPADFAEHALASTATLPITSTTSTISTTLSTPATSPRSASSRRLVIRTVTPATPILWTSRPSSTTVINFLQKQKDWANTAVVIAYDDSDGWYDHQMGPIVNQSATAMDALTAPGQCGTGTGALAGVTIEHAQGRCGYGPRLPLLVISPYAKQNYVDHTVTDQSSILRFIEDNWLGGQRITGSFDNLAGRLNTMFDFKNPDTTPFILNTSTGQPTN